MSENWFFRWIWRFNAVALALWLSFGVYALVNLLTPSGTLGPTPREGLSEAASTELHLQLVDAPSGSDHLIFSYGEPPVGGASSFGPPRVAQNRNYLFHNVKDGSSRWLFPDNRQVVADLDYVWHDGSTGGPENYRALRENASATHSLRAIVYDVLPSHGDVRAFQVYASRADGTTVTKLIDGADEQATFTVVDPNTIVITNRRDGRMYATMFSLIDFKKTRKPT